MASSQSSTPYSHPPGQHQGPPQNYGGGPPPPPPGLAIAGLDVVVIQQHMELLEVISGMHMPNSYSLRDVRGIEFMRCSEATDGCSVACLGNNRDFIFTLRDPFGREVIVERTQGMTCMFPFCCLNRVQVVMGQMVCGFVQQQASCGESVYFIQDANDAPVLKVVGPACVITCCNDVEFPIQTMDGVQIGVITRKYPGFLVSSFTAADNFVVTFPLDLDTRIKLVLVGATLLVDFLFFENVEQRNHHHSYY